MERPDLIIASFRHLSGRKKGYEEKLSFPHTPSGSVIQMRFEDQPPISQSYIS
jgi:hypothetical protein